MVDALAAALPLPGRDVYVAGPAAVRRGGGPGAAAAGVPAERVLSRWPSDEPMAEPKVDPDRRRRVAADGDCSGAEPFALMVLGDSMAPEFVEGEVIVVEPEGLAADGAFVVAQVDGDWTLRQLVRAASGWRLRALNPAYAATPLADLAAVRGVVIQKSRPGRRRSIKRYVE